MEISIVFLSSLLELLTELQQITLLIHVQQGCLVTLIWINILKMKKKNLIFHEPISLKNRHFYSWIRTQHKVCTWNLWKLELITHEMWVSQISIIKIQNPMFEKSFLKIVLIGFTSWKLQCLQLLCHNVIRIVLELYLHRDLASLNASETTGKSKYQ